MKKKLVFGIALLLSLPFSQAIFGIERITSKFRSGNFFSGDLAPVAGLIFLVAAVALVAHRTASSHSGHPEGFRDRMGRYGNTIVGTAQRHPKKIGALIGLGVLGVGGFFAWPFIAPVIGIAGAAAPFVGAAAPWVGGAAGVGATWWGAKRVRVWYNGRHMQRALYGQQDILNKIDEYEKKLEQKINQVQRLEFTDIKIISQIEAEVVSLQNEIEDAIKELNTRVAGFERSFSWRKRYRLIRDDVLQQAQQNVQGLKNLIIKLEDKSFELARILMRKYSELSLAESGAANLESREQRLAETGAQAAQSETRADIAQIREIRKDIPRIEKTRGEVVAKEKEEELSSLKEVTFLDQLEAMEQSKMGQQIQKEEKLEQEILAMIEERKKALERITEANKELLRVTSSGESVTKNDQYLFFLENLNKNVEILKSPKLERSINELESIRGREIRLRRDFSDIENKKRKWLGIAEEYGRKASEATA